MLAREKFVDVACTGFSPGFHELVGSTTEPYTPAKLNLGFIIYAPYVFVMF
jgi:hypothetical protein